METLEDAAENSGVHVTEVYTPEMNSLDSGAETGTMETGTGFSGRSIEMWTDQEAGLITDNSVYSEEETDAGEKPAAEMEAARKSFRQSFPHY